MHITSLSDKWLFPRIQRRSKGLVWGTTAAALFVYYGDELSAETSRESWGSGRKINNSFGPNKFTWIVNPFIWQYSFRGRGSAWSSFAGPVSDHIAHRDHMIRKVFAFEIRYSGVSRLRFSDPSCLPLLCFGIAESTLQYLIWPKRIVVQCCLRFLLLLSSLRYSCSPSLFRHCRWISPSPLSALIFIPRSPAIHFPWYRLDFIIMLVFVHWSPPQRKMFQYHNLVHLVSLLEGLFGLVSWTEPMKDLVWR